MGTGRLAALVSSITVVASLTLTTCTDDSDRVRLYRATALAPSIPEAELTALEHLGPVLIDDGINFAVYSEHATRIDLLLFDDPEAERPTRQFEMVRFGDVWSVHIEGIGPGQHYGYVAWGPNWPFTDAWRPGKIDGFLADVDAAGNRMNPNKLLIDPYAKAVHRDHDWARASLATGPARTQSTWGAGAKSVVVQSTYTWSPSEAAWRERRKDPNAPGNGWHEQIVYEVHPKGFTADPASGVEHPGTFRGIGELAPYLADLGITAVELLPVFEKPMDGGYWGYHTINWFVPEFGYSATKDPREIIDEFKFMVDALHQNGIELWLDVVYNHSGEGGLWREKKEFDDVDVDPITSADLANYEPKEVTGLYSLRGLDNQAYYCLTEDKQTYWYATGVGNQMRANHRPYRKLIMDTLRYWSEEMHVDGFRFDLAPALGASDSDYENWDVVTNTVLQDIVDDPTLQAMNVRVIAEPWAAGGNYRYQIGQFPTSSSEASPGVKVGWYEWNGRFRDWWRAFMNDDNWRLNSQEGDADGGFTLTGCDRYYRPNGRGPYHSVNFLTVHDGMTLYDVFTYGEKKNGCGPLNPTCCDDPLSVWCDIVSGEDNNRSRDWGGDQAGEAMKRQLMRNLFVALLVAHGTPMIYGGDEWMRTQFGNNNAYSTRADNSANWFQWGTWKASDEKRRMHDFVKQMIALRKRFGPKLMRQRYDAGPPFAWKSDKATEPPDWSSRHLMMHYTDQTGGPELAILFNLERYDLPFTLPTGAWRRLVDTQSWFDSADYFAESGASKQASSNATLEGGVEVSGEYVVKGSSIVILERL
ncbi:MAG: glycosyl hydrolase [Deltaproteobacteria bacterium]|nr:glycosyl hydrolase [Deltaproteobacteria bacterium]